MVTNSDPSSFLTTWLKRDKKLVTYRLLSRELRIHVDEAKSALASYFESNPGSANFDATYILIGRSTAAATPSAHAEASQEDLKDDKLVGSSSTASTSKVPQRSFLNSRLTDRQNEADTPRKVIRLVSAERLEEAKRALEEVTSCHIYSLSPGKLRDVTQLTAVRHDLHTQQKYLDAWQETNRGADLGVIINPTIKDNYDPSKVIPSLGAPSAPALAASKDSKSKTAPVKTEAKEDKPVSTQTASTGNKKATGLNWSKAKPKDSESKSAPVKQESSGANAASKRQPARKALLGSDDEDDEQGANRSRSNLVDDDDDDDDGKPEKLGYADDESDGDIKMTDSVRSAAPKGSGKRADAKSQTKAQEAAQRKKLEAMMDSDDDDVQIVEPDVANGGSKTGQAKDLDPDVKMADSTITGTMNGSEDVPSAPKRRVRKKRKIGTKKIRTKDERGYTVTKMEDEYESYSSEESDVPVVTGSKRGSSAAKSQTKQAEARSLSTSASASPAPAAPAKSTPAPASSANRKPSSGAAPAKKGQQSLNSFFTRKPK